MTSMATFTKPEAVRQKAIDLAASNGSIIELYLNGRRAMSNSQLAALGVDCEILGLTETFLSPKGPAALEIQHLSAVILERVNRFFGWQAIGRIAIRQAPLRRREPPPLPKFDDAAAVRIAETLPDVKDDNLRQALGRLGSAIKGN